MSDPSSVVRLAAQRTLRRFPGLACAILVLGAALASPGRSQETGGAASSTVKTPRSPVYYSTPSWSPDGASIAFESNRDGEAAVYTIRPDGSGLTRLSPAGTLAEQPCWSPDGRHIVFTRNGEDGARLCLMRRDGSNVVPLPGTANGFLAAYSPDGRWLLFASQDARPSLHYRVIVMRPDGSERHELGDATLSNEDPGWSVDGRHVLFAQVAILVRSPGETGAEFLRRRDASRRFVCVAPDGSDSRVIPAEAAGAMIRDRGSSPDGKWRVFSKTVDGDARLCVESRPPGTERVLDPPTPPR